MKSVKRVLSIVLCIVLMLSSAPVLNLGLFKTDAAAVSYAKKHEKEYYYDSQTKFIEYIAVGCDKKSNNATNALTKGGYTKIDMDLNKDAGGYYIYLGYIASSTPSNPIKDLRMLNATDSEPTKDNFVATNGFTYTVAGRTPTSKNKDDGSGIVDLNRKAGGATLNYYATKDANVGDPIIDITVTFDQINVDGYEAVKYINSGSFSEIADANKGSGGKYIYTHVKRLPQVDTTKLRETMETAATAIANTGFIESSKASLKNALAQAEKITNAYDDYRAGTDAYNSVYDQTKIDAAEKAIKEAMDELVENVDDSNAPKVTFYVPETIYLNPNDNRTFQYFYGVGTDGKPIKNISNEDAAKGAMVYFDVANCTPTSVKITVEASSNNATDWKSTSSGNLSSITYGETTTYSSFPVNIQCTAGKMNSAVPAGGYRFLKWTAQYVVDGMTFKAYAYSLCYAPYDKPAAAASRAYTNRGINHELHQIAWISGITGSANNGNRTNNTTGFDPLKGVISTPKNATNNGGTKVTGNVYFSGTSGTSFLTDYNNGEVNAQAQAVAPKGSLVLDSTRFSNLKYVPNLKIGYLISYSWEGSNACKERRFGYYFSDVSNISYEPVSENNGKDLKAYTENRGTYIVSDTEYETTTEKIDREYCRPRLVYNGIWDKEITSSQTVNIKGAARFGTRRDTIIEDNNGNVNCADIVPLEVTVVDKASLRKKVNDTVSKALQENWFANGYDVYQNSLLAMAINLENPASAVTSGNTDRSKLERSSGTVTTTYFNERTGSAFSNISSESKEFTSGEDVSIPYKAITGYSLSSYKIYSGSTELTTGLPNDTNTYYIRSADGDLKWEFRYSPNKYTATYDPNGGSYNGTTEASTNQGTYETAYSVGVFDGTAIDNPTRTGYVFASWKCDANGSTYNSGDSLNWSFAKNIKFTAQWTPITYTVEYNPNGGSGSTAPSTHTYDVAKNLTACGFTNGATVTYDFNGGTGNPNSATVSASFAGWAISPDVEPIYSNGQSVKNLTSENGGTVTLYAKWTDGKLTLPDNPTRTGYTFSGWYTEKDGGDKVENGKVISSDITLYAHWTPITYTVEYNPNGGSGSTASSTHTYDVAQNLTKNGFERKFTVTFNYNDDVTTATTATATAAFNGWAKSASGAVEYADGASVINLTSENGGTVTLYANWTDASVDVKEAARKGYVFKGWFDENGNSVAIGSYTPKANVILTARWEVIEYKITFKNGDTILQDTAFAYDTMPTFTGTEPTKESDNRYEYTFSGWSPEITKVTGETTYEAQFTATEHHFKSVNVDGETHRSECDCGYKLESTKHNIELKDGKYTCKDCGYVVPDFNAVTADGATLTKTLRADMTTKYLVATVSYPNASKPNKEGKYFVYWYDRASGEIVSAFTTYSFFLTKEVDIIPIFATQKDYYTERAKATTVLRMVGCKQNEDKSYSILAERSISSSAGSINSHGMIYTTDASLVDKLTVEGKDEDESIRLLTAQRTSTVRTGLYEAKITGTESDVVYARPYIVLVKADGSTETVYGKVVTYNLLTNTQAAESDVLSTNSYDLSDISAEEPVTPTEPTEKNPLDMVADFFARLVEIIKTILSFFGLTGVAR